MRPSLLSGIVLAGVFGASAAGWLGVRLDAPAAGQPVVAAAEYGSEVALPAQPGVRNRASWQPSPIPSNAAPAPAVSAPGQSPAPKVAPKGPTGAAGASAPYVSIDQLFTTDRLEAAFDGALPAVQGEWREVSFFSRALNRETAYMVWLPPGYSGGEGTYPALYLLHGVGGEAGFGVEEWLGYALTEDLDRLLALKLIEPMIVVLPNGEQSYWMNHSDGGPKWADFVAVDLVKHVDATFRTEAAREKRAVGGLSMGGHGALQLALNHSDVFAIAGAHSPTLRSFEDSPEFFGDQKWFARFDPLSLAKATEKAPGVTFWIDNGHTDKWGVGANAVAQALSGKRAPVTYRVLEGEHEGWYWKHYLPEYLNFYAQALHATSKTPQGAPAITYQPIGPLFANTVAGGGATGAPVSQ